MRHAVRKPASVRLRRIVFITAAVSLATVIVISMSVSTLKNDAGAALGSEPSLKQPLRQATLVVEPQPVYSPPAPLKQRVQVQAKPAYGRNGGGVARVAPAAPVTQQYAFALPEAPKVDTDPSRRATTVAIPEGTPVQDAMQRVFDANRDLLATARGRPTTVTLVSGIWNIGRGSMPTDDVWAVLRRPFTYYTAGLETFLSYNLPKVLYTDADTYQVIKPLVDDAAGSIKVVIRSLQEVRADFGATNVDAVQRIRTSAKWLGQSPMVANSPQALLQDFNPLVMSKLRFTRDAARWNPFGTDGFLWLDGACVVVDCTGDHHHCFLPAPLHQSLFCSRRLPVA
jgi:hypothetical protein